MSPPDRVTAVAELMAAEATSLTIASAAHLGGWVNGRGEPFDPVHAGIAEGLLATVMAVGALSLLRRWKHGKTLAISANAVSVVGFLNGLNMTLGGHLPDIAYHLAGIPLLIAGGASLWRQPA